MILRGFAPPSAPPASPSPNPPSVLELTETAASFGDVHAGAVVTHRFPFRNRGRRPVRITGVRAASTRGEVEVHPEVVPPGGEGYVEVRQPIGGRLGLATFRFAVKADDGAGERRITLGGFVQSAYDPDQPLVDFGTVAPGSVAPLDLFSREVDRLEVRDVVDAPPFLSVEAGGRAGLAREGVALRLRLALDVPLGDHAGAVRVRTNVEHQPEVTVAWRASVFEDVAPSESPVDLGVVREGRPFTKAVRLERRSGAPLEVERVDAGNGVTVEVEPCPEPSAACRALRLRGVGPPAGATLAGALSVTLKDARPMSLAYSGIAVGADTAIKDIGAVAPPPEKPAPPPSGPPPPAPAPVVGRPGDRWVRITWEARQEQQTYGYLVYRSDQRDGPFRRVSPQIVKVAETPGPHVYTYLDEQVAAGRTYYYYLESVGRSGRKARFSGVVAKVIPAEAP
jgi:hypothetical protein